jgi:hypothetical protein
MGIVHVLDELKIRSERRRDRRRVVPFDWQAAALRRSLEAEGRDDRGSADLERSSEMRYVRITLRTRGEEVENGAIMPDVYWRRLPITGDIRFNPRHACSSLPEPCAGSTQRCG